MNRQKTVVACWLMVLFGFGLLPGTFMNYGWNYWQFLPLWGVAAALLSTAIAIFLPVHLAPPPPKARTLSLFCLPIAATALFWFLRTKIHCFGGDGAVGLVPTCGISWCDFIPPMPGKRLDGYLMGVVGKLCRQLGVFDKCEIMPSIMRAQIYSVIVGSLFVGLACFCFRKRIWLLSAFLTFPFIFNFFGNIDSYAFSLLVALAFMIASIWVENSPCVGPRQIVLLCLAWAVGLWTHPFHVFSGFIVATDATRFLRRFRPFHRLPDLALPTIYGIFLFAAIKASRWSNSFFIVSPGETPPSFSADTFTHYLNMILLPIAPLIAASLIARGECEKLKAKAGIFLAQSAIFFIMAFTLGAADQFNYQHLLLFFITPWIVFGGINLPRNMLRLVAAANVFLLIPMVAVHSTTCTIKRAQAVYPLDPCKHNMVMSWQTHLGLVLGDNLQADPSVKKACLKAFAHGARHANPPGFRGGNLLYHTAFLYHFGDFIEGRKELFGLLKQNPQALNYFLNVRPAFIYCNRKRLWDDIELFLKLANSPQIEVFRNIKETLLQKATEEPYYIHRPSYAETEV